jgi:hypothetical protein
MQQNLPTITKKDLPFKRQQNQRLITLLNCLLDHQTLKKQYEYLSDLVRDLGGKVHGSQSHIIANNNMYLIVYYEVPTGEGQR